jgi:hypothetical protein
MALWTRTDTARRLVWALLAASAGCALAYAGFIAAGEPAELSDAAGVGDVAGDDHKPHKLPWVG